jgi:protein required for attachment to host cells
MIVEHGTLVVVADGGGAIVYRNAGHEGAARLEIVESHDAHHASFARGDGSDKPGRYTTPEAGRTAIAGHDYHEQTERAFAARLAARLDELVGAPVHDQPQPRIVLFASPRFLGTIRSDYSARLKAALRAEVGKDLREAPSKRIEHALTQVDHL